MGYDHELGAREGFRMARQERRRFSHRDDISGMGIWHRLGQKLSKTSEGLTQTREGLTKTRDGLLGNLRRLLPGNRRLTPELYEELETALLAADLGMTSVTSLMEWFGRVFAKREKRMWARSGQSSRPPSPDHLRKAASARSEAAEDCFAACDPHGRNQWRRKNHDDRKARRLLCPER